MDSEFWILEDGAASYGEIKSYRDLIVWQKAMELTIAVYEISKSLPADEKFGLISQVRRSAVSIPSNISEGWGRKSLGNYIQFLRIAFGSLCETETQLELCVRLDFIKDDQILKVRIQINEIEKMLKSLIKKLEQKNN